MVKPKLLVVSHTNLGNSLSGGDQIFLNLIKYWSAHFKITLLASPSAINLLNRYAIKTKIIKTTNLPTITRLTTPNLIYHHLLRFITGLLFCFKHRSIFKKAKYIYTSSDFYGDFIFGIIAKLINPKINWICGYYLVAPKPFDPKSPYHTNHQIFRGLVYYLAQIPTTFIANHFANSIFITSLPDKSIFPHKSFVVQGGVYLPTKSELSHLLPPSKRQFDAFFLGRLHSQKGVIEMIEIWKLVINKLKNAKLIIVGDGELMDKLIEKIKTYKLTKNITIVGFKEGANKYNIIKNSKIVLHPATYDSGGMAAAEAMAWGLPGVSFDLPALKTYYPQGVIKTTCFDKKQFAKNIISLLTIPKIYHQYSKQALTLTKNNWNWKKRFENLYYQISNPERF